MNEIALHVGESPRATLHVQTDTQKTLCIGGLLYGTNMPEYEGSYEANALFSEQVFDTEQKVMTQDFTVHAINYTEAPNSYGVTVTIGG